MKPPSPWPIERAKHGGKPLVRYINLEHDTQAFVQIDERLAPFCMDGDTIVAPTVPGGRDVAELATIVREYDSVWAAQHPDSAA